MNLKSGCRETVDTRQRWLLEALVAQTRVNTLPNEISELECGSCEASVSDKELQISIYPPYDLREDPERLQWVGQTKLLFKEVLGIAWDRQIICYGHSNGLYWRGKADNLHVTIFNAPKPPLCKITETREYKEHITYKAECPEEATV